MAWVYIIQNAEGRFYIGMTTDLEHRLIDHNTGVSKWTQHRGPWKLVWSKKCASISEARKLENKLKRQGRGSGFYRMIGLTPRPTQAMLARSFEHATIAEACDDILNLLQTKSKQPKAKVLHFATAFKGPGQIQRGASKFPDRNPGTLLQRSV